MLIIFGLKSIIKQLLDLVFAFFHLQLLNSVLKIRKIINVSVIVISCSPSAQLINTTSTLIILHITKTSSNNCLLFVLDKVYARIQ